MEEKKKIYVRGRKGRGSEIHGILTGLGATDAHGMRCENEDAIYFINHKNKISCALIDSEVGAIVMDNYKEIEFTPLPWKDGDILVDNNNPNCYAVFKKYYVNSTFEVYFILYDKTAHFDTLASVECYHLASSEELENVSLLFSLLIGALNEVGLCLPKKV